MKRFVKIIAVTGMAVALVAMTTPKAQAIGGWGIAGIAVGSLALGTAIGAHAAYYPQPAYYAYPQPAYTYTTYAAPVAPVTTYAAPVGQPQIVQPAPAQQVVVQPQTVVAQPVYAPPVVYAPYPYCYGPVVRVGYGWGPRWRHYHRW